jgi:PBP1b-binding outer membrane lipoprotein LpoB
MKKINILLILLISILIFNSCTTVKEGFRSQKKNSTDEFLVEKKSPLIMPPEFNELPIPDNNQKSENNEETHIKKLITNNENSSTENISNQNTNFENSILEKIKNN